MFHNKWLYVDKAIEPSLIMWENLGYNKQDRFLRIFFTTITSLILLIITVLTVLVLRTQDSGLREFTPEINCSKHPEVDEKLAFKDQQQPLEER